MPLPPQSLADPILVIPDVHANVGFLRRIFEQEDLDRFAQVVCLGDYFDGREPDTRGPEPARATALFLRRLADEMGERLVLLWGNHDLAYYAARGLAKDRRGRRVAASGSGVFTGLLPESQASLDAVHQEWSSEFWKLLRVAHQGGGRLFSHAGVHPSFWPVGAPRKAETVLRARFDEALAGLGEKAGLPAILRMGAARGGENGAVGGPLWLDWEEEFKEVTGLPQIVGHTVNVRERQKGASWNIDFGQLAYAVVTDQVEIRRLR